jgi:hypothetical protein
MAYNISTGGIALALPFPLPVGTALILERRMHCQGEPAIRARVLRCGMDGCVWLHGCAFVDRLSDAEVRNWLPLSLADLVG